MTALAVPAPPAVPALIHHNPVEIDANDIALPRVKVAQQMTAQADAGLVKSGQIFSSISEDDADVLFAGKGDGVLFHVLGLRKGKSLNVDGDLMTWAFNDPDAPADAWTTYNYVLCLPEHDTDVPYKFLMTRTATPTARGLNLMLKKGEAAGPSYALAFRLTTAQKKNAKGTYYVPIVRPADPTEAGVAASERLAAMIADALPEATQASAASAPAI